MRILVVGSGGFIGSSVSKVLGAKHQVIKASRYPSDKVDDTYIDLLDESTIRQVLLDVKPEAIINCAGIVSNSEEAEQNLIFTTNLLKEVVASKLEIKRIIILGSAAEYGLVDEKDLPVKETAKLNATSAYGMSKVTETTFALDFAQKHSLPVVIARVFNPIGNEMPPRQLIPGILSQIEEIRDGTRHDLEVSRLDSKRDYIHVLDLARAICLLVEGSPEEQVYNIGSGTCTSNNELIQLIIDNSNLANRPIIKETSVEPEPPVAIQADIGRISAEFGWTTKYTIAEAIKEIVHAEIQ